MLHNTSVKEIKHVNFYVVIIFTTEMRNFLGIFSCNIVAHTPR